MYTARKTPLGKLRSYERELASLYVDALARRCSEEARQHWARRQRVRRAILQAEEWHGDAAPLTLAQLERTRALIG